MYQIYGSEVAAAEIIIWYDATMTMFLTMAKNRTRLY